MFCSTRADDTALTWGTTYQKRTGQPIHFRQPPRIPCLQAWECQYYGSSGASETGQGYFSLSKDGTTLNCEEFYFTHAEKEDYSDLKVYYNTTGSCDIKASEESDMTLDMFWDLEPFSSEELSLTSFADYELERGAQAPLQDGSLLLREID